MRLSVSTLPMKAKILTLIAAVLLLAGCSDDAPRVVWKLERKPTTDAERKAIAEHVERILAATPHSLSGNDQDWDDAVIAAERLATVLYARPVMREWEVTKYGTEIRPTGRWYYLDEVPPTKTEGLRP